MHKIAIAGFQHETNTFGATKAHFGDFEMADAWPPLLKGDAVLSGTAGINLPIAGFVEEAEAGGDCELIPLLWCSAEPSSFVTDTAFERIAQLILDGISSAAPLDGIYLDLHGAMVTESHQDGEGELLRRIRNRVGPDLPLVVSLDLHANVTASMVQHASALTIFRTYPHLDMAACGARAAQVLRQLLAGTTLFKSFRQLPFLIPLHAQDTGAEPCRSLYQGLGAVADARLPYAEIAMGFPPADIVDAGPSVVGYAETQAAADTLCQETFQALLDAEGAIGVTMLSPAQAAQRAIASNAKRPIVIADVQDNPGAGATSDTTGLLRALVAQKAKGAVLGLLHDPKAAERAHAVGVGAYFDAALGGQSGLHDDAPYHGRFIVEALSNGQFAFTGEMYRGSIADIGRAAVLRVDLPGADIRVVISEKRCQCLDQAIFRHFGIALEQQRIIVVKSTVHFRADFESLADEILVAEAPGLNFCRPDKIPYQNLRSGVRLMPQGEVSVQE